MTAPGNARLDPPTRRERRAPSRRHIFTLAALTGALARAALAQTCPPPTSDSASGPLSVIPAARGEALGAVVRGLRQAGYRVAVQTDSTVETVPSAGWPTMTIPIARHFLEHEHPGIVIRIALWPEGDSTFVETVVRALCGGVPDDPPHDHVSIEQIAVAATQLAVDAALLDQVRGMSGSRSAATPGERRPQLQYCPAPSPADSLVQVVGPDSVQLTFVIDTSGLVEAGTVTPVTPGASPAAIERARLMVVRCRFTPAIIGGRPVRARVTQSVRFRVPPGPPPDPPSDRRPPR